MPANVQNGELVALSPSMISAFDPSSSFGCERRGWYKYVMGLEEPSSPSQAIGTALHALIEKRLLDGQAPAAEGEAAGLYLAGQAMIERVASLKILGVEQPLKPYFIDGVPLKGYVDVVHEHGIIDWKTSSDIRRYGKTPEQLAKDTQMILYGRAMHPEKSTVLLAHGQFQTKGSKRTDFVEVEVSRNHLDSHIRNVIVPLVQRIREVVKLDESAVPGDTAKCGRCPFNNRCTVKGDTVMSFFNKLKSTPAASPTPPPTAPMPTPPQIVTPPDAPVSDPALAAKPVEGFSPIPPPAGVEVPAPKRRGRPPGSKNKPKMQFVDVPNEPTATPNPPVGATSVEPALVSLRSVPAPAPTPAPTPAPAPAAKTRFKSVTVTKGATINLGDYNSARVEISVTVEGDDYEVAYYDCLCKVDAALDAEGEKFQALRK